MRIYVKTIIIIVVVLISIVGCGQTKPAATSVPATATRIAPGATNTLLPPTVTAAPSTATSTSEGTSAPPAPTTTPPPPPPTAAQPTTIPPPGAPFAASGGAIAFVSDRDGNAEIYLMAVDGSGPRNITNSPFSEAGPAWSPAGAPGRQQIVFSSTRNGNTDIYVMAVPEGADPDSGNLRRLTEHPAVDAGPVWSPDGTQIAFVSLRDGNAEIYVIDADGSDLQRLTRNSYDDWEVDWSPDGTQIAVSSQVGEYANIYIINVKAALQGTAKRQQLTDTKTHDAFPKWSPGGAPGGQRIAFISNRKGGGNWDVYVMDADGSNQRRLTYSDGIDGLPTWSPDGTQIAFESNRDGDNEIYVLNVKEALQNPKGAEILRLTNNDANDQQPAWRPSGATVDRGDAQRAGLPIDEFLRESFRQLQLRDADSLFTNGFADFYGVAFGDRFTDLSIDYIRETQQLERDILDLLRTYDRSMLSADQQISYDSFEWYLTTRVRGHAFADYKFLINPVWGLQNWPIDLLLEHPLENKQDAENYIARLSSLDIWAEQVIEGLERNEQVGAIPPKYVLEDTIDRLDAILNMQGTNPAPAEQFELYIEFSSKVRQIGDLGRDERDALLNSALAEIEGTLIPAYQALKDRLIYLTTIAVEDPNQWKLPGGDEYYAYLLAYYTGTSLSADEIHALGLAEVARIQADIRDVAVELGYPAEMSMAELNQRMTEESQIVTGDALHRKYEQILTAADEAAEAYFDLRTSADVVIRTEPNGPPAYYESPEPGSPGPGVMPVNLDFSPLYANYNEHVLVHHETIPGHHTQIALAQELDLPGYQRFYNVNPYLQDYEFQAYAEGWALYAEILAWEMGLYEGDPFANLGRLRLRLLRTVRIVADTGIHAKGWTLDEAAAYLEETTGLPQSHARLTRYLVNPGYPCGYNIGGLKILEMRQRAREQLGDRFDIKEFHNTVLGNGVLPIGVLENVVDDWIEAKLGRSSNADVLAQLEGLPLDEFFEQSYRQLQLRDPDALFVNGLADEYGVANDRFTNMSDDYQRETQQLQSAILDLLRTYDRSALPPDQQLSYDVYEWVLDDLVRGHEFAYYDYPVNSLTIWGKQNWLIDFMVNYQAGLTSADATATAVASADYIARLSQIDTWVEQLLAGLKLRELAGVVPPRYIIEESISQVEGHLHMQGPDSFDVEAIELYTSFREKLDQAEGLDAHEKQILLDAALTKVEQTFIPAFLELRDYLLYLETIASDVPGVHRFPKGQAYYAYVLHHQTGTDMSAEQIHNLGLSEVTRLQAEMQAIAAELGYPQGISMAELEERLSAHGDSLEGDALLAEYKRLIAEAEQATDSFFDLLPGAELVIQPEPFGSGIGYYLPPPLDGSGPGVFYTTLDYPLIRHIIPSFIFHETVPGHHLQGALARELSLPTFRRELDLNGYVEGWAVYAEQLAWEMGLYENDPLGNLGRLQFELSRAARLVIDTGMHAKGWTRQQAAAYYEEATGRPASPAAMHRYVILPGQGCGYTIGMLKILELRQRAMDRLGDRFDIKEFHNVVLGSGSLPLEILERVVQDYIESKSSNATA